MPEVQADKDRWDEVALCKGTQPTLTWVWSQPPGPGSVDACMSMCRACPVMQECRQAASNDMGGDPYRFQVVGGLRLWIEADRALLPDPVSFYKYVPPRRGVGRPQGPLPGRNTIAANNQAFPLTNAPFNPFERNENNQAHWNTPPQSAILNTPPPTEESP